MQMQAILGASLGRGTESMQDEEFALHLRAFGRDGQADEVAFRSQSY